MKYSDLIVTIGSFSTDLQEEFSLFLNSPYFLRSEHSKEMLRLFYFILDVSKTPQLVQLDPASLHEFLYPQKNFSAARIERTCNKLTQLVDQFLLLNHYFDPSNESQRALDMTKVLRIRNLPARYEKQVQKIKKETESSGLVTNEQLFLRLLIAKEQHEWNSLNRVGRIDQSIPDIIENLDLFYHLERLEMLNRFLLQQKFSKVDLPKNIQSALESTVIPSHIGQRSPLIRVRQKILDFFMQQVPDPAQFEDLLQTWRMHENEITGPTVAEIYTFLRNCCTYLILIGHHELEPTLHEIQKDCLDRGLYYLNDQIGSTGFLSVTRLALVLGHVQWAKDFVESHKGRIIDGGDSEEVYKLGLAMCYFEEGKYEETLDNIVHTLKANYYILQARRLELKVYYELRSELLSYKIDAFRKHLERSGKKKYADVDWVLNNSFINILTQIVQSVPKTGNRSKILLRRINQKKIVAERKWLIKKTKELA